MKEDAFVIPDNNDPAMVEGVGQLLTQHLHPMLMALAQVYPASVLNRGLVAGLANMIASSVLQYGRPEDLSTLIEWAVETLRFEAGAAYTYMGTEGATRQ